jgi:predicted thioredoxin/glutaredoxin
MYNSNGILSLRVPSSLYNGSLKISTGTANDFSLFLDFLLSVPSPFIEAAALEIAVDDRVPLEIVVDDRVPLEIDVDGTVPFEIVDRLLIETTLDFCEN